MTKTDLIDKYLKEIELVISANDEKKAYELEKKIHSIYAHEIKWFPNGLDKYYNGEGSYIDDLKIIEEKLINYKADIEMQENQLTNQIKYLELQKSNVNIHNNNYNENNNSLKSDINITIENVLDNIKKLNEDILSNDEKEKLEEMISSIEVYKNSKDKSKVMDKIGKVLKYLGDKSVEVGIAILPYLGQISQMI